MNALIISLKFHPGHVSHLVASYKQCEEIGLKPFYFISEKFIPFLPKGSNYLVNGKDDITSLDVQAAFFHFPNVGNISLIRILLKKNTKIFYFYHEPMEALSIYWKAGFRLAKLAKLVIGDYFNRWIVKHSSWIILPSKKAYTLYTQNNNYKNKNILQIPLIYDDESIGMKNVERSCFSYIGTIAADHSFDEYLNFIYQAIQKDDLNHLNFLIATKSDLPQNEKVDYLRSSRRLRIIEGHPLTDAEINECYAQSICIWNAYARTTQSGVLAKSFMFGTPAIVLRANMSELNQDGKDIVAIDDNGNYEEIRAAVNNITDNIISYSQNCRERFLSTYYYRKYNQIIKNCINER